MTDGQWLTYADAADRLGITTEAIRALARRQRWERRSPNAIGGQAWVLVPADRLAVVSTNGCLQEADGHNNTGQRSDADKTGGQLSETSGQKVQANGYNTNDQWAPSVDEQPTGQDNDRRATDILTAVREVAEILTVPLREQTALANQQIEMLTKQLAEVTDRAESAEARLQEMRSAMDEQTAEHRRVVEALVARIPQRRSWWPWRR